MIKLIQWRKSSEFVPSADEAVMVDRLVLPGVAVRGEGGQWRDLSGFPIERPQHWAPLFDAAPPVPAVVPAALPAADAETIRWRATSIETPPDAQTVATVYVSPEGKRVAWLGYYSHGLWRDLDNLELLPPTWWAPLFQGPGVAR